MFFSSSIFLQLHLRVESFKSKNYVQKGNYCLQKYLKKREIITRISTFHKIIIFFSLQILLVIFFYFPLKLVHNYYFVLETFFLNLFFSGKLETMPPKYRIDKGDLLVIRPLSFCKEEMISTFAKEMNFPIIPCNLCGSQPQLQRQLIKVTLNK